MNGLDYAVLGITLFSFWRGWRKGLLRSVFGPVAFAVCVFYAYAYYQRTRNMIVSFGIGLAGPVVLNVAFWLVRAIIGRDPRAEDRGEIGMIEAMGRFSAGVLSAGWMCLLLAVSVALFAMVPISLPGLENARAAVLESKSLELIQVLAGDRVRFPSKDVPPIDLENDPAVGEALQEHPEYVSLMNDERMAALFADPVVMEKIQKKDIAGLLTEPKIQEIMHDPKMLEKFLKFQQVMLTLNQSQGERSQDADDIHKNH